VSFDAIAPWYRTLETIAFGNALQRARVACLNEIVPPRRALIVGEGNGRFLHELIRAYPHVEVDCVDASERMLALTRERIGPNAGIRFLQDDITSWTPASDQYDLIVTHFVLDCFSEDQLARIIEKLSNAATADASWLLADFCISGQAVSRLRARAWLALMYRFFRIVARIDARQLVDPSRFLRFAGFTLEGEHFFRRGIVKSEAWRRSAN
jgi:SAM-dependent methyltransferase